MGESTALSTPRSAWPPYTDRFPSPRYSDQFPPDTDKPPTPYTRDQVFTVLRHTPPPPYGGEYPPSRLRTDRDVLRKMTQLEYCLSAAPLGGRTRKEDSFTFVITKEIAVRENHRAQVFQVNNDLIAITTLCTIRLTWSLI